MGARGNTDMLLSWMVGLLPQLCQTFLSVKPALALLSPQEALRKPPGGQDSSHYTLQHPILQAYHGAPTRKQTAQPWFPALGPTPLPPWPIESAYSGPVEFMS